MKKNTILKVNNLSCYRNYIKVFSNINFTLEKGKTLLVKGKNGSGKTSLLLSISGILPKKGNIRWSSNFYKIGYVGHKNAIRSNETVGEYIRFWKKIFNSKVDVNKILLEFGLNKLDDFPCNLLSFGQKKILSFIRLLLLEGRVWLLDEPLSGLDKKNKDIIIKLIKHHNFSDGAVIMTTHDDHLFKKKINFKELIIDKNL